MRAGGKAWSARAALRIVLEARFSMLLLFRATEMNDADRDLAQVDGLLSR
jgi:hypothetical protein